MANPLDVALTPAQIVQIVRAIDKAGPEHATGPSAGEHSTAIHRARALLNARRELVKTYTSLSIPRRMEDRLPLALPWASPWRLEGFFSERVGLFEPQDEAVEIPHEGTIR